MDYTPQQIEGFKTEFARRKKLQFAVAVPFILVLFGSILFRDLAEAIADSGAAAPIAFGAAVVGMLVFSLRNWRCPACDRYLGRSTSMRHCPKCGVTLR